MRTRMICMLAMFFVFLHPVFCFSCSQFVEFVSVSLLGIMIISVFSVLKFRLIPFNTMCRLCVVISNLDICLDNLEFICGYNFYLYHGSIKAKVPLPCDELTVLNENDAADVALPAVVDRGDAINIEPISAPLGTSRSKDQICKSGFAAKSNLMISPSSPSSCSGRGN